MDSDAPEKNDVFIRLFTKNQSQIYGYIVSLIGNLNDGEDIFQDVASAMWLNFDKFQQGTDFTAWGIRIAKNKVIDFVRKRRSSKILFSDETIALISDFRSGESQAREIKIKILEECIGKLSQKDQDLVKLRYNQHNTTKSLADRFGRSVEGLYKTMARIHCALYKCMQRKMESA
ncbi:MAG: sigma-70 family RNA polymerase sigma factor [Sedimentisphaerales bacterium]|nr:sigma-70 family RNA polymerase sigma factor [Sedimentisphaerales bacterium]MBN2842292.1 sigma-70 family RNA polymerase sigma factor [Sedimentisphaerales bacterium]